MNNNAKDNLADNGEVEGQQQLSKAKRPIIQSKTEKWVLRVVGICCVVFLVLYFWSPGKSNVQKVEDKQGAATKMTSIQLTEDEVSEEQAQSVDQARNNAIEKAELNNESYTESVVDFSGGLKTYLTEASNVSVTDVIGSDESVVDNTPTDFDTPSNPDEKTDSAAVPTLKSNYGQTNSARPKLNSSSGKQMNQGRTKAVADYWKRVSSASTGEKSMSTVIVSSSRQVEAPDSGQKRREFDGGMDFSNQKSDESLQQGGVSSEPVPRVKSLFIGDKMIGHVKNGISSTSPTKFVLVEVDLGPLKGARIVYTPELKYDTWHFQSEQITWNGHVAPFRSIIVTPDANLTTGYRSDVDYHTLYRTIMTLAFGFAKGTSEFIKNVPDEVIIQDSQTTTITEYSGKKMFISGVGGVADLATDWVQEQINKPPTVTITSKDTIGIMLVENWTAEWAPKMQGKEGVF